MLVACSVLLLMAACGEREPASTGTDESSRAADAPAAQTSGTAAKAAPAVVASAPVPDQALAAAEILNLNQRWSGDYDDLAKRRFLRVLVPFSRTLYYMDGAEQKGIAFEALRELEKNLPVIGESK